MRHRDCPLCNHSDPDDTLLAVSYVTYQTQQDDSTPPPEWVRLKRDLEAEFELEITVTALKTHVNEHLSYVTR